ncbi:MULTISPECIES: DoxX family membrane protein [Bacteroidota]|jgi:thiosulfate dehydrogenase [quinone] large subunit|uniref:DoxX family membrane protein n=1 Tax=Flectobacillus rivi TaxID=2984209 RepID=A0ABT6Z197_9BACT|nr:MULTISPECIES: DoxX family membrane protein [Bacteroidota]MDI9874910.1 DoxX family membrane protein [Flectobacillus rivi]NBB28801.1 DoxX family membrane protein [Cellulophaga sp. BC115SP]
MNTTSFLLLRLGIGISMFGHGLVRLPKLAGFSKWMVTSFEKSLLPSAIVTPFSYALPILEFGIGTLLILGLLTKQALLAGSIVMLLLLLGTTLIENWEALPSQLIHLVFFAILIQFISSNTWSLDYFLFNK